MVLFFLFFPEKVLFVGVAKDVSIIYEVRLRDPGSGPDNRIGLPTHKVNQRLNNGNARE